MLLKKGHSPAPGTSPPEGAGRLRVDPAFIRYLLIGLVCLGVDLAVLEGLLLLGVNAFWSHAVSRPAGGITCFLLNRAYTFRAAGRGSARAQMVRFWVVFGASFAIAHAIYCGFHYGTGISPESSKLLAEALVFLLNFFALKHWTFR